MLHTSNACVFRSTRVLSLYVFYPPSAAEPPSDFPPTRSRYVLVPVNGTNSTQLKCDIRPGVVRERYSIEWNRINPGGGFTKINEGIDPQNFSLTLPVDISSNSTVYMCTVDINHDGNGDSTPYDGAKITLRTAGKCVCVCTIISYPVCIDSDVSTTQ